MHAVELRGTGLNNSEIATKLDTSSKVVSHWVSEYCKKGIEALKGGKYGGNRRNMSWTDFNGETCSMFFYKISTDRKNEMICKIPGTLYVTQNEIFDVVGDWIYYNRVVNDNHIEYGKINISEMENNVIIYEVEDFYRSVLGSDGIIYATNHEKDSSGFATGVSNLFSIRDNKVARITDSYLMGTADLFGVWEGYLYFSGSADNSQACGVNEYLYSL